MRTALRAARRFGTTVEKNHQTTWEEVGGHPCGYSPAESNLTPRIWGLTKRKLFKQENHPITTVKDRIKDFFDTKFASYATVPLRSGEHFKLLEDLPCVVSVKQCFDDLLVPVDHVTRSKSDTYYVNKYTLLRTHTSAHQVEAMASGLNSFLIFGDVYRRDEINQTHYPAFHQLEGVRLFNLEELGTSDMQKAKGIVVNDLKSTLLGLATYLAKEIFNTKNHKWVDGYFPFTEPSFELETEFKKEDLEILGCGAVQEQVLKNAGRENTCGWAFGIGVDRWAMKLFEIPDIKLLWSQSPRFLRQFRKGVITKFVDYGKQPACYKDISFWVTDTKGFSENELFELARNVAGDLIEYITCRDVYEDKKRGRISRCYRISYCHRDRVLTNVEVDALHGELRKKLPEVMNVKLR